MLTVLQLAVLAILSRAAAPALSVEDCKSYDERPRGVKASSSAAGASPAPGRLEKKVVCSNLELRQVLPADTFASRTLTLILSNNKIEELRNGSFLGLSYLERLDIRNNIISHIEAGAFVGLQALKRLDLSNNRIGCLNKETFNFLPNLVRLNLSGNLFSSLSPGLFDRLSSLKILEFHTVYLLCDCHLRWFPGWARAKGMTVKETRCSYPRSLQGHLLVTLQPEDFTCDAPLELPSFHLTPTQRQVVFRGDGLPLRCLASYIDEDMQLLWYKDGREVELNATEGFIIHKMIHNCTVVASTLTISNIHPDASGIWECVVSTSRGKDSRSVDIVVVESSAQYCPAERVINNKGEFRWLRTLAGITTYLPCNRFLSGGATYSNSPEYERGAWRRCGRDAQWAQEDYSLCPYQNEVTRVLHIINQMPLNLTNAMTLAQQLWVYTMKAANFSDKMDIFFVAQMIEKIGKFADKDEELGELMVAIASSLMQADKQLLWTAQKESLACTRIVESLLKISTHQQPGEGQSYSSSSPNIALEFHAVQASNFPGMTCALFRRTPADCLVVRETSGREPDVSSFRQLGFKCNMTDGLYRTALRNTPVEASVFLPPSLLYDPNSDQQDVSYTLKLLAFKNGKLFPSTAHSSLVESRSVATPILMVSIAGAHHTQLLPSPVNITFRRHDHGFNPVAVHWNSSDWDSSHCELQHFDEKFTNITCSVLGVYTVLTDPSTTESSSHSLVLLHPVIYVTSAILLLCLLAVICTYICFCRSVQISRKSWHMLVNLCLHMSLSCAVYAGGVTQTQHTRVCQAVGMVLHYSSLATLLWVGVTARNIYKQLTRQPKSSEELDEPPPPPRPMLRFYLIAGGIPLIVCGITAAANIRNYGSQIHTPYCWMAWEPSVGAFYGPVGFIILVDCLYFLVIVVQLRLHPDRCFELKELPETAEAPVKANEQSFVVQLRGASLALLLWIALWVGGALSVSQQAPLDLLFSFLFGGTAIALGAFMLTEHCLIRTDVRRLWLSACCRGRWSYSTQAPPTSSIVESQIVSEEGKPYSEVYTCTNTSCKLTNLQAEAEQCKPRLLCPGEGSQTEHSLDLETNMHVAAVEPLASRPHRNRPRFPRSSRLAVLRNYAHDVPTSVEGSERQVTGGRERFQSRSQSQLDSSEGSSVPSRHCRSLGGSWGSSGGSCAAGLLAGLPTSGERAGHYESHGSSLAYQNGSVVDSRQSMSGNVTETSSVKTGLWKQETTV